MTYLDHILIGCPCPHPWAMICLSHHSVLLALIAAVCLILICLALVRSGSLYHYHDWSYQYGLIVAVTHPYMASNLSSFSFSLIELNWPNSIASGTASQS